MITTGNCSEFLRTPLFTILEEEIRGSKFLKIDLSKNILLNEISHGDVGKHPLGSHLVHSFAIATLDAPVRAPLASDIAETRE